MHRLSPSWDAAEASLRLHLACQAGNSRRSALAQVWQSADGMVYSTTIAELQRAGIVFRPGEAIAIVQKLINEPPAGRPQLPFGPLSIESVVIDELGTVTCTACDAKPAVSEIAILLDAMLPAATRLPGALRYTIARALLNVDAPPFDSIEELSSALSRFERHARDVVIRDLMARAGTISSATAAAVIPFKPSAPPVRFKTERRCGLPSDVATELRRELRRADLERYARQSATTLPDLREALHQHRRPAGAIMAGLAAGVLLIASGGVMQGDPAAESATAVPSVAAPAPRLPEPARSPLLAADLTARVESSGAVAARAGSTLLVSRRNNHLSIERSSRSAIAGRPTKQRSFQLARAESTNRRTRPSGVLARLHLQWVRNIFTYRPDL
jgi:hypothetical protein